MFHNLLDAGLLALKEYIAAHVLTCLVPAFLLAGAMVTSVNREAVLDYLGEKSGRIRSYTLASISSLLLAACSCTVIPVAAGLYYSGAGIGPAFIILWVAPAANILALVYTGSILGREMVVSRFVAAVLMAFVVGITMSTIFEGEKRAEIAVPRAERAVQSIVSRKNGILILFLLLSLLLPNYLVRGGSYVYKVIVWAAATAVAAVYAVNALPRDKLKEWMRETWWFVRMIFPLLLAGVFLVGIVGNIVPENWIARWLGGNGVLASFLATLIGAITYFATMTEAPFVDTFMKLGMGKGPALALLLTGPGLSLPNWLAIARVFGAKKSLVYVTTIVVLGTLMGWVFGNVILG